MKKLYIALTAIAILLLFVVNKQESDTIIIYSSAEQFRNDELQLQINKKFPDLKVRVMYTPTAKAAAKVMIEGENTDADIIHALEIGYINNLKHLLGDVSDLTKIDYLKEFNPKNFDNHFVIWERYAGSFTVNRDILDKHNLPVPSSYEDLLDPMYKNLIAMPDPKSSGTGFFYYKNLVNVMGEQAALEYFDKLSVNIKQFTESGSGPVKLLNQGEVAIGLAMTFQSVGEINKGMPLEIYFPQEGSPYSMSGTGIVKKSEHKKDVRRVFDFLVNDFIKYDKEHFSPEMIMKNQIITMDNYPTDVEYADMTGIEDMAEKERLLSLWKF